MRGRARQRTVPLERGVRAHGDGVLLRPKPDGNMEPHLLVGMRLPTLDERVDELQRDDAAGMAAGKLEA